MTPKTKRYALVAAAMVAGVGISICLTSNIHAQEPAPAPAEVFADVSCEGGAPCYPWQYGDPALFYNFYTPNYCGGVPTQLYIAPRPVPPSVGHTYYTYQPLMPHEFTYPHSRTYRAYYDCGRGMTRTKVHWYSNPVTSVVKGVRNAIRLPR